MKKRTVTGRYTGEEKPLNHGGSPKKKRGEKKRRDHWKPIYPVKNGAIQENKGHLNISQSKTTEKEKSWEEGVGGQKTEWTTIISGSWTPVTKRWRKRAREVLRSQGGLPKVKVDEAGGAFKTRKVKVPKKRTPKTIGEQWKATPNLPRDGGQRGKENRPGVEGRWDTAG